MLLVLTLLYQLAGGSQASSLGIRSGAAGRYARRRGGADRGGMQFLQYDGTTTWGKALITAHSEATFTLCRTDRIARSQGTGRPLLPARTSIPTTHLTASGLHKMSSHTSGAPCYTVNASITPLITPHLQHFLWHCCIRPRHTEGCVDHQRPCCWHGQVGKHQRQLYCRHLQCACFCICCCAHQEVSLNHRLHTATPA